MSTNAQNLSEAGHSTDVPWFPPIRHLLVAIDLSSGDESVIDATNELIQTHPEIAVTLLTVIPDDYLVVGDFGVVPDPMASTRKKAAGESLEQLRCHLPENVKVECLIREGRPATEICRTAKETQSNFIFLTCHGRTGVQRALLGSTAEEVVHNAPCSVLILKAVEGKSTLPLPIERLGVAFDESESSRAALALGLKFMRHSVRNLELISAVEPITLLAPEMALISDRERLDEAQNRLERVCKNIPATVPIAINVRLGKPWQVIRELAEEQKCDLLIIGAHEYWRPGDWILGTTAEKVVRHAVCPVLIVRPVGF